MSGTDMITVGRGLPKIASVEPADAPLSVAVTWADGSRAGRIDLVNLAPIILVFKVLRPLRDDAELFKHVQVGAFGASLVWPGYADLDIGADAVEELAEQAMSSSDFAAFIKRHGFTLDAAAAQLGVSRRLVAYYAKTRHVPRTVALACAYLDSVLIKSDLVEAAVSASPVGHAHLAHEAA